MISLNILSDNIWISVFVLVLIITLLSGLWFNINTTTNYNPEEDDIIFNNKITSDEEVNKK